MSGVYGWLGPIDGDARQTMASMQSRVAGPVPNPAFSVMGPGFALGASGPAGTAFAGEFGPLRIAFHGHPLWHDGGNHAASTEAFCERFARAYRTVGVRALDSVRGDFAIALIDADKAEVLLAIDRIGIRESASIALTVRSWSSVRIRMLLPNTPPPGSRWIRRGSTTSCIAIWCRVPKRCLRGIRVSFRAITCRRVAALSPPSLTGCRRSAKTAQCTVSELTPEFRSALRQGVGAFAGGACGTFLSGGTDSSTVSGILGEVTGAPARTYSIGFEAAGYDEMAYARIAARHFRTDHHEYYVTPADVVEAIPIVAAAYGQPFGNASAIPTYFCAKLAREDGVTRMLGGDGGDELFGGNSRYARQYQFSLYSRLPQAIRARGIEPLLLGLPGIERIPVLRKARSYVAQARLPMPERYESYNLLERLGAANLLEADFLAGIDPVVRSR